MRSAENPNKMPRVPSPETRQRLEMQINKLESGCDSEGSSIELIVEATSELDVKSQKAFD